eukprot:3487748-Pyramimonas_sp.AAC.1
MVVCQFGVVLAELVYCFKKKTYMEDRIEDVFDGDLDRTAFLVVAGVYTVLLFVTSGLLGELYVFHMILWRKQMTTYDYIVAERLRKEEESQRQMERDNSEMGSVECEDGLRYENGGPGKRVQKSSGFNCKTCRRNGKVVAEDAHTKRRHRSVTINPCRLLKTERVEPQPRTARADADAARAEANPVEHVSSAGCTTGEPRCSNGGEEVDMDRHYHVGSYLNGANSPQGGPASESYDKAGGNVTFGDITNRTKPPLPPGTYIESHTEGQQLQTRVANGFDQRGHMSLNSPSHASFASQQSPSAVKITYGADAETESEDGDQP